MGKKVNNHYVSQTYLKRWTSDGAGAGSLCCFDKQKNSWGPKKPEKCAYERRFNLVSEDSGLEATYFEDSFAELESHFDEFLNNLLGDMRNQDYINIFLVFPSLYMCRNPKVRDFLISELGRDADDKDMQIADDHLLAWLTYWELKKRKWEIVDLSAEGEVYTCDKPVLLYQVNDSEKGYSIYTWDERFELSAYDILFPLTPSHALYSKAEPSEIGPGLSLEKINSMITENASRQYYKKPQERSSFEQRPRGPAK